MRQNAEVVRWTGEWWVRARRRADWLPVVLGSLVLVSLVMSCGSKNPTRPTPGTMSCINYADFLRLVGSVDTPDQAIGVAISGTHD